MKVWRIGAFALLLMLGLAMLAGSATVAQETDPAAIYQAAYDAFNAGDIEGGMAYFAEDVIGVVLPALEETDPAQIGKAAFQALMEEMLAINAQWEFDDFRVSDNTLTYRVLFEAEDPMAEYGLYPLELYGHSVVRNGLIESEVWSLSDASRMKMDAVMARMADEALVARWLNLWDTVNGDMAEFDEIVAEDFVSHNLPEGDREAMRAGIEGFRADNPGAYFPLEQLVIADGKAYVMNRMWMVPEGAAEGETGEPVGGPLLLVLGLEDGQVTERQLFVTPE